MDVPPASSPVSIGKLLRAEYPNLLFLITLEWAVHFLHLRQFGLYEDDWYFDAGPYVWGWRDWFHAMWQQMEGFVFGRPIEILLLYVHGFIGYALDSIAVLYWLTWFYWAVAIIVVYVVLRQRFPSSFVLLAGVLWVLSPIATVHQYTGVAYRMSIGHVIVFGAILLYLRRRPWIAYPLASLALFTYEWLYLLFFAAPLFDRNQRLFSRRIVVHGVLCVAILAAAVGLRAGLHEQRLSNQMPDIGIMGIARVTLAHLLNIPVSFANAFYLLGRIGLPPESIPIGLAAVAILGLLLWRRRGDRERPDYQTVIAALGIGFCLTVLGLSISFVISANTQFGDFLGYGRISRLFVPAEVGVALMVAGLWMAVWLMIRRKAFRYLLGAVFGVFVLGLASYQFVIQHDYALSWAEHQHLAQRILELTPDADPDSTIMVRLYWRDPAAFNTDNRFLAIGEDKTMFCRVLYFLYRYGQPRPSLYFAYSDAWRDYLKLGDDGKLHWTTNDVPGLLTFDRPPLNPGRVIQLYELKYDRYARFNEPVFAGGVQLTQPFHPVAGSFWSGMVPSNLFRRLLPHGAPVWKAPEME